MSMTTTSDPTQTCEDVSQYDKQNIKIISDMELVIQLGNSHMRTKKTPAVEASRIIYYMLAAVTTG